MIKLKRLKNYLVEAQARQHSILSDVRLESGGDDMGMTPHEILEASLAACTAITLQMYANRKGIPLDDVKVEVAVVSEGSESVINRQIEFIGVLSEAQKNRMIEIANHCPIHKLLESQIKIKTQEYPHK